MLIARMCDMTAIPKKRNTEHVTPEHDSSEWMLRDIADTIKKLFEDRNCDKECPAMRELKQKVNDNEKSQDILWEKMDWIFKIAITTLIGMLGTAIGIILILAKLK
jgi:hypothetical protein